MTDKTDYSDQIAAVVEAKLQELANTPVGTLTGRRLQLGGDQEQATDYVRRALVQVGNRLGVQFLEMTPAIALEQLAITAAHKDHDVAGLIKSLINSFLVSYATPETCDESFGHLLGLESLRATVGANRMQTIQAAAAHITANKNPTKH